MFQGREVNLTSEYFESLDITISQPKQGFRYGGDTLGLADFCRVEKGSLVAEFGSGCGVISLIIAKRDGPAKVAAVEIQKLPHDIAVMNCEKNSLGGIVECINKDYRKFARENASSFDVVVSNPPFLPSGKGRKSPDEVRAIARIETAGTIAELVASARVVLKPHGKLVLVFPKLRYEEFFALAEKSEFRFSRQMEGEGKVIFVEFVKGCL